MISAFYCTKIGTILLILLPPPCLMFKAITFIFKNYNINFVPLGLPAEIFSIHFGNTELVKKLKEHQEKLKKELEQKKTVE